MVTGQGAARLPGSRQSTVGNFLRHLSQDGAQALPQATIPKVPWNKSWDRLSTDRAGNRKSLAVSREIPSQGSLFQSSIDPHRRRQSDLPLPEMWPTPMEDHDATRSGVHPAISAACASPRTHKVRYYGIWNPANRPLLRRAQLCWASQLPEALPDEPTNPGDVTQHHHRNLPHPAQLSHIIPNNHTPPYAPHHKRTHLQFISHNHRYQYPHKTMISISFHPPITSFHTITPHPVHYRFYPLITLLSSLHTHCIQHANPNASRFLISSNQSFPATHPPLMHAGTPASVEASGWMMLSGAAESG